MIAITQKVTSIPTSFVFLFTFIILEKRSLIRIREDANDQLRSKVGTQLLQDKFLLD